MTAGPGLGIVVAALATISYNVGLIFEKRALGRLPAIDARHAAGLLRTVLLDPAWLIGFAMMACGFSLQVIALMLAPVSVVQPVLGSGVVILVALSRTVLRERLRPLEFGCVVAVAVAIAAIALSATGSAGEVGHHGNGLIIALVALPVCLGALAVGGSALRSAPHGRHRLPAIGVSYGLAAGLLYGVATLWLKSLSGAVFSHSGGFSGLVLAVLGSPYPYLTVACSAVALLIFQTGLQRCRVSIVGPVSNITGSVFFLVAGTWLFGERLPSNAAGLILRLGGIIAAGVAVVVLARQPASTDSAGVITSAAASAEGQRSLGAAWGGVGGGG
ncbi:MAG TPA: DMT family transporter [Streptosporangiaceae bacterium]|nr:DMT family transporter [Streptosporangiaceae bacterium]